MADENRAPPAALSLEGSLLQQPYSVDFLYAMRRLECLYGHWPRLGKAFSTADEPVRIGQDCSMAFAPSAVSSCRRQASPDVIRLGVAFLGLFGPNGPLPLHLTEYALERARRHKDNTLESFVNLFQHRMLCLFYRGWANSQPTVSFDRPAEDRFGEYVASLCGLGLPSLRDRDDMEDSAKIHFAGRLLTGAKCAEGLVAIIRDYFRVTASITEFMGEWLEIGARDRCLLGMSPDTGSLGTSAVAGAYVFECQHKFRIDFGPVGLAEFEQLLPGGGSLSSLVAVVRSYVGDELAWDLKLILRKEEVPVLRLGADARLGWTTWLGTRPGTLDADDLVLEPIGRC